MCVNNDATDPSSALSENIPLHPVLVALVSQHHCLLLVSSGNDEACFDPEISPEAMPTTKKQECHPRCKDTSARPLLRMHPCASNTRCSLTFHNYMDEDHG